MWPRNGYANSSRAAPSVNKGANALAGVDVTNGAGSTTSTNIGTAGTKVMAPKLNPGATKLVTYTGHGAVLNTNNVFVSLQ